MNGIQNRDVPHVLGSCSFAEFGWLQTSPCRSIDIQAEECIRLAQLWQAS